MKFRQHRIIAAAITVLVPLLAGCVNATKLPYPSASSAEKIDSGSYQLVPIDANFRQQIPTQPKPRYTAKTAKKDDSYHYQLGAGDVLLISLYVPDVSGQQGLKRIIPLPQAMPEENQFEVDENGNITLPYAGVIQVAGKTLADARADILQKSMHYFRTPQLDVSIKDYGARKASLTGEFKAPKELILNRKPLTLLAAVQAAEGPTEFADLSSAILERADGSHVPVDLHALLEQGDRRYNFTLRDGDLLHLPRNHGNKIFVTGEVMKPKSIILDSKQATLTEVLTTVEGLNSKTADPSAIYVLRDAADGGTTVYQLDLENAQGYVYGNRFHMQPQDVVFVSSRSITDWSRFIEQLLPGAIATLAQPAPYIVR